MGREQFLSGCRVIEDTTPDFAQVAGNSLDVHRCNDRSCGFCPILVLGWVQNDKDKQDL
ncbi:hypothetical protein DOT_1803 [Desulfosporosinus sp. OT]|nr:hypothetical protein DOT_1803 [Desulfosporosinus sp. OT]